MNRMLVASGVVLSSLLAAVVSADQTQTLPPLQGRVEQTQPATGPVGDEFHSRASGPTTTNQPGVGGSPYCRLRDAQCGGTDRRCYDEAYQSTSIVLPSQTAQALYGKTQGQIWIRCGACGSEVICWPRPEYRDLIASKGDDSPPATPTFPTTPQVNYPASNQSSNQTPRPSPCPEPASGPVQSGPLDLRALQRMGWYVQPIHELKIIDKGPGRYLTGADRVAPYQTLVNGTFFGAYPAGPIIGAGGASQRGDPKTAYRGAIAVAGKTIFLRRQAGYDWPLVRQQFGNVDTLMGGGAMLIENGRKVSERDLARCQQFGDRSGNGFQADQLNHGPHMVIASVGSAIYLVFTGNTSGASTQNALFDAGFTNAIVFDGGAAAYLNVNGARVGSFPQKAARFGVLIR